MSAEAAKQNVSLQRINARATSCVCACVCLLSKPTPKRCAPQNVCVCLWWQETTVHSEGGASASLRCAPQCCLAPPPLPPPPAKPSHAAVKLSPSLLLFPARRRLPAAIYTHSCGEQCGNSGSGGSAKVLLKKLSLATLACLSLSLSLSLTWDLCVCACVITLK